MILYDPPNKVILRNALGDASPASTSIPTHQKIGLKIPIFVVVQRHVHRIWVVQIGANVVHERGVRNVR